MWSLRSSTLVEAARVLHSSFVDFITNKEWCTDSDFLVDVRFREIFLARNCLEPITNSLRQNLAGIEDKTADFEGRVKEVIPSQLQYARLHWTLHMIATEHEDEMCLSSLHEFTHVSLLYWLEAMRLLGYVPRAILMMWDIHAWTVSGNWLDYAVTED